jgi:PAS domain-containing protein
VSAAPLPFRERDDDLSPGEVGRRYRTLIEQLPLVVYVDALDAVSSNIFTSPQIEPLLGYSVDEWKADTDLFARLLHEDDRERVLAAHAHTHETHEPLSIEYRLIARGGRIIAVPTEGDKNISRYSDHVVYIPDTLEPLQPMLSVVPLQLLAYHAAVIRGCNVDKPRNLAKSVTVE